MMWPSFVTITPEPSEFWIIVWPGGWRNRRWLPNKNSNGSTPYWRWTPTLFDVLMATTEGSTLLTSARLSRFNASSDGTCAGSTLGFDASEYFSGFRTEGRFRPPCLRR